MNSTQIMLHIELYARERQIRLAARLAHLQQFRDEAGSDLAEIEELKQLILAGGCNPEEQAVMLESLRLADDFAGVFRNSLNQVCVLVRREEAAIPEMLPLTFSVGSELLAAESAARMMSFAAA